MKLCTGDIFANELGHAHVLLFTANSYLDGDQRHLVMGAGIAKTVRDMFPGVSREMAQYIYDEALEGGVYGVRVTKVVWQPPTDSSLIATRIGAFQTKINPKEPATLELVQRSVEVLLRKIGTWQQHTGPDLRVAMNFPGIGYGKLNRKDVLPIIEQLPDQVRVYENKK